MPRLPTGRPRGRPSTSPPGRNPATEHQHLAAWYAAQRERLPAAAKLARLATLHPTTTRLVLAGTKQPAAPWLDQLYPVLATFGYEPPPPEPPA